MFSAIDYTAACAIASNVPTRNLEPAGRRQLKGFSGPVRLWSLCD